MKFLSWVLLVLMFCSAANAYVNEGAAETAVLPGDQNTNLHKLNAFGEYAVKRLKKIDQALGDQKGNAQDVSWADLNSLLSDDSKENEKILQRIAADVDKTLKKPQVLIISKDEMYKKGRNLPKNSLNDAAIASALNSSLKGGRR